MKGRRVSVIIVLLSVTKAIAIKLLKTTSCAVTKDTKEIIFHKKKQELGLFLILWGFGFVWGFFLEIYIYKSVEDSKLKCFCLLL